MLIIALIPQKYNCIICNKEYFEYPSRNVKRLQILPGRRLKVKSDNLNYDPFEVSLDTDNFHIVGKVIWAGALLECIK